MKAAVFGARQAFKQAGRAVPIQSPSRCCPRRQDAAGHRIPAVLATLEAIVVDVIGLNCSTGPEDMRDAIRFLGDFSTVTVHASQRRATDQGPNGETIFPEEPGPLAGTLREFVER